ncbi:hypothetical protein BJV82DRAFT_588980 [Fennellomyces sp. T-0311]|nr:hypothetical protein BJV82DRAFT_588980 [Fennellomyces sp. T-0311]
MSIDDGDLACQALERICVDGICHCDWRITVYNCEESVAMVNANLGNIVISGFAAVFGIVLLIYRIWVKGHSLWICHVGARFFLRPKPVDSMLAFFAIFNTLQTVSSIVLVADIAPGDCVARTLLFEVPWSMVFSGISMYLIGMGYTISQSTFASGWLPSSDVLDILCCLCLLVPLIVSNSMALAGSLTVRHGNYRTGIIVIRVNHGAWFIWTSVLGLLVLLALIRLVDILKNHRKDFQDGQNDDTTIESGIKRIQIIAWAFITTLWLFGISLLSFSILRDQIIVNKTGSVFLGVVWTYIASFATIIAQVAVILSPKFNQNLALELHRTASDERNINDVN